MTCWQGKELFLGLQNIAKFRAFDYLIACLICFSPHNFSQKYNRGAIVKEAILKENPSARIDVMELDVSSMASVRKFASEYSSSGLPLNLLINNAGVNAPFALTEDNIELMFGTNHIGHFLLTNLLFETMKSTARESQREGRIVIVASEGHRFVPRGGIRFDKINDESRSGEFGAATTCYVALHPQVKGVSGEYFSNSNIGKRTALAKDEELAKKLWDFSSSLTDPK
ncbi:hypothetical protein C3L33_16043, partial [Rhododendron williamsianum]